jgi:hypothetical protein
MSKEATRPFGLDDEFNKKQETRNKKPTFGNLRRARQGTLNVEQRNWKSEIRNWKLSYRIPSAAIALCLYARPKGQMIPLISIPSLEMEVMCLTATMNDRWIRTKLRL